LSVRRNPSINTRMINESVPFSRLQTSSTPNCVSNPAFARCPRPCRCAGFAGFYPPKGVKISILFLIKRLGGRLEGGSIPSFFTLERGKTNLRNLQTCNIEREKHHSFSSQKAVKPWHEKRVLVTRLSSTSDPYGHCSALYEDKEKDMQQETTCKRCGKPIERVQGHKPRVYCRGRSCRQLASRATQRAKRRQPLREQWQIFPLVVQNHLETLADQYGDHVAQLALETLKVCFAGETSYTVISIYRTLKKLKQPS